jgi:glutamate N-acetyltransferase/amino-acid N-acetyltransferase
VQDKIGISIGDHKVVEHGALIDGARLDRVREVMGAPEYTIEIDLGQGRGEDRVWTSDLTEEYVRLNSKYTT